MQTPFQISSRSITRVLCSLGVTVMLIGLVSGCCFGQGKHPPQPIEELSKKVQSINRPIRVLDLLKFLGIVAPDAKYAEGQEYLNAESTLGSTCEEYDASKISPNLNIWVYGSDWPPWTKERERKGFFVSRIELGPKKSKPKDLKTYVFDKGRFQLLPEK